MEQYKEKTDKTGLITVDDRTSKILIHVIKESLYLQEMISVFPVVHSASQRTITQGIWTILQELA